MPDIVRSVRQLAESEMLAGVTELYPEVSQCENEKTLELRAEGLTSMDLIKRAVSECRLCALSKTRTNTVFGEGDHKARLMFIGEAPGRDEDIQSRPFVGRAGKLLTDIVEAMGLKREDVYIANILKCRPPENRNPMPDEIDKCSPYLLAQIKQIKPKVICSLGKFATQTLLRSETPISELRGRFHDYNGIKLMPTYHPAYLLRNPSSKKDVWNDMKKIAKELDIAIPLKTTKRKNPDERPVR